MIYFCFRADYADDIALLANTHIQAETLLHSLERAASGVGLHVNAHKTEYICYNQTGDISTLDGTSLKLVDKFTYSVSSTEKDIDTRLTKAWTAIDTLSIIWKSDLTDKLKSIDQTLSGATTPSQSRPGSDGIEEVLRIPQNFNITGTSQSDCLVSHPGLLLGALTLLQRCSQCILQPHPTGLCKICIIQLISH